MDIIRITGILFVFFGIIGIIVKATVGLIKRLKIWHRKNDLIYSPINDYSLGKVKLSYFLILVMTGTTFVSGTIYYYLNLHHITQEQARRSFAVIYKNLQEEVGKDGYIIHLNKTTDNETEYSQMFYLTDELRKSNDFCVLFKYSKNTRVATDAISISVPDMEKLKQIVPTDLIAQIYNTISIEKIKSADIDQFCASGNEDAEHYQNKNYNTTQDEVGFVFLATMKICISKKNGNAIFSLSGYMKT